MTKLTEAQVDRAFRLFYGDGLNLGQIADDLDCGIYSLSPWLYAAANRIARQAVEEDRQERAGRSALSRSTGRGGEDA